MDRVSATITGQFVSGYTKKWTSKDGSKSGESGTAYILRDGSNAPVKSDMKPEVLATLVPGERYDFDVLIKARSGVTETGMFVVLDLWVRDAVQAKAQLQSAA